MYIDDIQKICERIVDNYYCHENVRFINNKNYNKSTKDNIAKKERDRLKKSCLATYRTTQYIAIQRLVELMGGS